MESVSPELVCCDEATDHQVLVELIEGGVIVEHAVLCLKVRVRLEWSGGYYRISIMTTSSDVINPSLSTIAQDGVDILLLNPT